MRGSSSKFLYVYIKSNIVILLLSSLSLQIKSMAQHLSNLGKLNSPRTERFSSKFMEDLDTLVGSVAMEICNKHVQVCTIMYIAATGHSTSTTLIVYDVILSHMTSLPHIQEGDYAKRLNTSLAFFIHDAFSLMDRGIVFILIKTYLKKVHEHVYRPAMVFQLSYITSIFAVHIVREGSESARVQA